MTAPSSSNTELLAFLFAQSYGKSFGDMSEPAPVVAIPSLSRSAAPVALDWHAASVLGELAYPVTAGAALTGAERWPALSALLHGALGILRVEPTNPFNPHRSYPSARSRFAVHAYLLARDGALYYDPVAHCLRPLEACGVPDERALAEGASIALVGCFAAFPAGYGSLRYALTVLEGGHVLANLALIARALGLAPRVHLAFADEALLVRLGLPRDGSFVPLAVLSLGTAWRDEELVLPGVAAAASSDPREPLAAIERVTWLDATGAASWPAPSGPSRRSGAAASAASDDVAGAARDAGSPATESWSETRSLGEVLYARNAGRAAAGLCGSAAPLAADVLTRAVAALDPLPLGRGLATGSPCGLHLFVVAERLTGRDDGIYALAPGDAEPRIVRRGRFLATIQQSFTYPASTTNIRSMHLVWLFAIAYPAVLERWGPRGLRLASLEMGWLAQEIALAAAADGLFARPIRSFREPVLDELLRLGPREMIGYVLLCGRNRFTDLALDLRPPMIRLPRERLP